MKLTEVSPSVLQESDSSDEITRRHSGLLPSRRAGALFRSGDACRSDEIPVQSGCTNSPVFFVSPLQMDRTLVMAILAVASVVQAEIKVSVETMIAGAPLD